MQYIDVSHYDWDRFGGNLNWPLIKSSGIDVAVIRASYGDPQIYNPQTRFFKEMSTEAKKRIADAQRKRWAQQKATK